MYTIGKVFSPLFFMLAIATAASAAAAPNRQARLTTDAKQLVENIGKGKFEQVEARFDAKMSEALPLDKLRSTWATIAQQAGELKHVGDATVSEHDAFLIVLVECEFANAPLRAEVVYDSDDKVAGLFFKPHEPAAYVAPGYVRESAFTERETTIGSGPNALAATLTLPKSDSPVPGVVLVHGSGPQDRDETVGPNRVFRDLAWGLASRGVAVLRYEKRTKAHPESFASGDFTVDDETVNDALAAAALLRASKEVDPSKVFVTGHSLGAMMAPRIAQRDSKLHGLILLAPPARPLEDIVVDQQKYMLGGETGKLDKAKTDSLAKVERKRDEIKDLTSSTHPKEPLLLDLPAVYWLDLRGYDPVAVAQKLTVPILVLQGERDFQVTAPDYTRWKALCGKQTRVSCKSYPALSHLFIAGSGRSDLVEYQKNGHVDPKVIDDITAWIEHGKTAS